MDCRHNRKHTVMLLNIEFVSLQYVLLDPENLQRLLTIHSDQQKHVTMGTIFLCSSIDDKSINDYAAV